MELDKEMLYYLACVADEPSFYLIHDPEPFTFEEAASIPWIFVGVCLETIDGNLRNVIFTSYTGNCLPDESHLGEWTMWFTRDMLRFSFKGKDYGKTWRLWAREPTPEQLAAHPWTATEES